MKSNAILLAVAGASVGVGMGQVNRVDPRTWPCSAPVPARGVWSPRRMRSSRLPTACNYSSTAACAPSQPGGSIRDEEVIAAAEQAGVTLYLTGARHFAH